MYLRYREPAWESGDVTDITPDRRRSNGNGNGSSRKSAPAAVSPRNQLPIVELHGIRLHAITEKACVNHVLDELEARRGGVLVTPNLDHLRRYIVDVSFRVLIAEADVIVPDGMPLVWASRIQGTPLPERVAGSNLISSLTAAAVERGRSIFLLGGAPGTAEGAAKVLKGRHPSLVVADLHCPLPGFEDNPREMAAIIQKLAVAQPDIVYVALGSPKQERLIARIRQVLPNAWWLGVGNSFSFLCGDVQRAPLWMQKTGLEWVHRLCQEPKRLFHRYIAVGLPFAVWLMGRSLMRAIPNRLSTRRAQLLLATKAFSFAEPPRPAAPVPSAPKAGGAITVGLDPIDEVRNAAAVRPSGDGDRPEEAAPISRLRAMVLLGGAVRSNALTAATGRSLLDLPLDENGSILNFWLSQAADVARSGNLESLPVRIMVDQNSPEPRSADARHLNAFRVERDQSSYRGTGGVLCDMCSHYEDDDVILVINGPQVLLDPLPLVVTTLLRKRGDIALVSHDDGTPSGIMMVKCKTLRLLPRQGFFDMKEQGLPLIASKFDVRVVKRRRPTGLPIRSLENYTQALHYYHRRRSGRLTITDPLAEDWAPSFSLLEPGATVDVSARIHDSIVLAGGCVEAGAVLVRSVVCPGAVVRRDRTAVDQLITIDSETHGRPKPRKPASSPATKP